jgi:ferredoxin
MAFNVTQTREDCIGCGVCAAVCPDNWEMSDDGLADPLNSSVDEIGCNQEAADSCPTTCIKIEEA